MGFKKSGKRMAKIKVTIISLFLLLNFNLTNAYEISDLIRILIDKNENSSSFKYDDLIDDQNLIKKPTQKVISKLTDLAEQYRIEVTEVEKIQFKKIIGQLLMLQEDL